MEWWIWLCVGIGLMIFEVVTPGMFVAIFLGAGALVAGLLAGLHPGSALWEQLTLFSLVSAVSIVVFRRRLIVKLGAVPQGETIDSIAGQLALALEDIGPASTGQVELRGSNWSAQNLGETALAKGSKCRISRVEGLTLFVNPER